MANVVSLTCWQPDKSSFELPAGKSSNTTNFLCDHDTMKSTIKIMVVGAQAKSNFVGVIILLLESFNTKNSKNLSHITLLQKVRATRGLVSHITTSMMVF